MRRREVIILVGGATMLPLVTSAQQASMSVIGFLNSRSPEDTRRLVSAFRQALAEGGFVEGQNIIIEYRWGLGQHDRLRDMASELVRRPVVLLATGGGESSALAAKAATSTIPIVFVIGGDPVKQGLATSLSRPGGNSTGVSVLTVRLDAKRLGLLRDLAPGTGTIGALVNPSYPQYESQLRGLQEAARSLALPLVVLPANTDDEIEVAFHAVVQGRITAMAVTADAFFDTRRDKLVALAAQYAVPTIYQFREFVEAGGLVSYGIDVAVAYRQIGIYAARILKGEKPADLPVMQPAKFELAINLKTAKALGLEVPSKLMRTADELVE